MSNPDEKDYQYIRSDLEQRTALCGELKKTGKTLSEDKGANLSTGQLSGMAGVEEAVKAYESLQKLYLQLGTMAILDAGKMMKIAKEFDRLDSSASVDAITGG